MNRYEIDGNIVIPKDGMATITTPDGHELFITYDTGVLCINIEKMPYGDNHSNTLAKVTHEGWMVSDV